MDQCWFIHGGWGDFNGSFIVITLHGVTVQLDKVEVHELKPKKLTKDKGVLVHY